VDKLTDEIDLLTELSTVFILNVLITFI